MGKPKRRDPSPDEQHVLQHGYLRLLTSPEEVARCDQAIVEHHYLHDVTLVGEHLRYAFVYKVSGWSHLGKTAGWKRDADDFYQKHDVPKQIWVRELVKKACVQLRAPHLPQAWAHVEETVPVRCTAKVPEIRSLMESVQAEVPEFRRPQARAYPVAGLLCLMVMAAAQRVVRGPQDLATYAETLSPAQLRALRFRTDPRTGEPRWPRKTTFTRVLQALDGDRVEAVLLRWQDQILGPRQDRIVIVDGKKVRHAGVEIVNAVDSQGRFLGSVLTPTKSNEIPAARLLLGRQDLLGKIALLDAMHTQDETAQQVLYEGGGDYLLTVKGNQTTLETTLENLFVRQGLSPSTHAADPGAEAGTQPGPLGDPVPGVLGGYARSGGLSGSPLGGPVGHPGQAEGQMAPGSGLSGEQSDAAGTPGRGDARAQAGVLGGGKPTPPLSGHHAAGR